MRAPDKQRYLDAVRHITRPDISFQENDVDSVLVRQLLGKETPMMAPYRLPATDNVALALACGNDLVYTANPWLFGRKNMTDADGRVHYVDGTIKARADMQSLTYPDVDEVRRRLEETLACSEGTGLGIVYAMNCAPFLVTTAVGYADYYMCLIDDPEFIHDFQRWVEDYCMRQLAVVLEYPVDAVQVGAVLCIKSGPMFSLDLMEEFEFPCLQRQIDMVHAAGRVVSLHSDGDNTGLISRFIDMGVDVLNPVEPCDGQQDIFALKAQYGDRIALHGNIDITGVLTHGTPDEVAQEVTGYLDRLAPGAGYVCASSHNVTAQVPLENILAMRDTVHQYTADGRNQP
jgi:hypothetical protein